MLYGSGVVDIHRGYKYRCYPTAEQVALLDDWQGKQRFLWNLANAQYEHAYSRCRADRWRLPSAVGQIYELTTLREMLPWLRDVPRDVQNQLLIELNLAWQRFVKGIAGRPVEASASSVRRAVTATMRTTTPPEFSSHEGSSCSPWNPR